MTETNLRMRAEIPEKYRWNAPSVFPIPKDWEAEAARLQEDISQISPYQGRLAQGPQVLLGALQTQEDLLRRAGRVMVYALLTNRQDTADQDGARMYGVAVGISGRLRAATAFINPELLAIGRETLAQWLEVDPNLKVYDHYLDDLFRKQQHVRSAEVEELLGSLGPAFQNTRQTANMLTDADFRFAPAVDGHGVETTVFQGNYPDLLKGPDRLARRTAYEHYTDTYLQYKNTLASNLATSIQQNVFTSRARRYPDTLSAALFENNIPVEVFHNLIDVFRKNLPTWHRYWAIRRKALGLSELQPYDVWAPLVGNPRTVSYEQAIDWIGQALAPLGEDYVRALRKGALQERWIDVYPAPGKPSSQFSAGRPGTHPFIFINYGDNLFSASTLAHELGHSMHSYLSWQNQPLVYSGHSIFIAEVASNFHQAMLRGYLLKTSTDRPFRISVIEEAMDNFHRYFFIMPTLARFEYEAHRRAERGQGLAADDLNNLMADLFAEGYGREMTYDRARVGITWATFGHLYTDYYVFQYATGISGANALARAILAGEPGAAGRYLSFLKAGSSLYPLDALKLAGVDLTTPQPVEAAFQVLSGLVDELERLVG